MSLPEHVKIRGFRCHVRASARTGTVEVALPNGRFAHGEIPRWYEGVKEGRLPLTEQMWTAALEDACREARKIMRSIA